MTNKSVGATIFGWAELIISLRALLFTIPVLLNKKMTVGFGVHERDRLVFYLDHPIGNAVFIGRFDIDLGK